MYVCIIIIIIIIISLCCVLHCRCMVPQQHEAECETSRFSVLV